MGITEKYLAYISGPWHIFIREKKKFVFVPVVAIASPGGNTYFATYFTGTE